MLNKSHSCFVIGIIGSAEAEKCYIIQISDFALCNVMMERDFDLQFQNEVFQCHGRVS